MGRAKTAGYTQPIIQVGTGAPCSRIRQRDCSRMRRSKPSSRRPGTTRKVEIFSSTEKSGTGPDGWLVEVAEKFNKSGISIGNGRAAKIRVHKIASGTGYQYIAARSHTPHAITPSNHLWVEMIEAAGIPVRAIDEKLVGNIAGIVMKDDVYTTLKGMYGRVNVKAVIDATVNGEIAMGCTNPFASSTGLNFLVTVPADFAGGDECKMLTLEVVSAFRSFQNGVPFVAFTTLQMRDSVRSGGALDQKLAAKYEFNPDEFAGYRGSYELPLGETLIQAQKLWKEEKDSGIPIAAIFLADVSGSMPGPKLRALKNALTIGSDFINSNNSVGLVTFESEVKVLLPIGKFDLKQKSAFYAAVDSMMSGGRR